jgi:hypothetical protein
MAKTWRRLPAKARQQLSDERLINVMTVGVENYGLTGLRRGRSQHCVGTSTENRQCSVLLHCGSTHAHHCMGVPPEKKIATINNQNKFIPSVQEPQLPAMFLTKQVQFQQDLLVRPFRTRPFRRTRTQTEVRNSDSDSGSDLRNRDFPTP